ncbi:MAG: 3-deoxy-D-manno-octulosonic acid transferase [Calditerrivibrio sp.]|nr:3-deoxy-D-manno-octulosonic acid transferase [Calditerrivibrio sp.]MCA1980758.1 3-deoxy-D-manno-octulosonic acid transferase [Calditerrivibrio sp.]
MLSFIYNILILLSIPIILPLGYIFAWKKGEDKDYFERFGYIKLGKKLENSIWFHCASVGEVRSIKSLINIIRQQYKDIGIIISTTTATGKKIAISEINPDISFLLPVENSVAISHIIDITGTKIFFIVDTEIWPNLIRTVSKKIPLYLINGRLSDGSAKRYAFFKLFFKNTFNRFTKIYTKSSDDAQKFISIIGPTEKVIPVGNIKFYNISVPVNLGIIPAGKRLFVAGSTHRGEEEVILNSYLAIQEEDIFDQLILAPRHLNRVEEVENLCVKKGLKAARFGKYYSEADVVIVDVFGILEYIYSVASKIFVGGSMVAIGGHNIFEALQFRKVVAVGKHMDNFLEIYQLAKRYNLVVDISNGDDMLKFLRCNDIKTDFDGFFEEIDKRGREILKPILSDIRDVFS